MECVVCIFKFSNSQIDTFLVMEHKNINVKLKVWRQKNSNDKGSFENYDAKNISTEMSFLEMFDVLNEELIGDGKDPIAFDHDWQLHKEELNYEVVKPSQRSYK